MPLSDIPGKNEPCALISDDVKTFNVAIAWSFEPGRIEGKQRSWFVGQDS